MAEKRVLKIWVLYAHLRYSCLLHYKQ